MDTYPEAQLNFIDVTALGDSQVMTTAANPMSNTSLFRDNIRQQCYGTMELNQLILDGSRSILPDGHPDDIPYWSEEKSDANGDYIINPTLEIFFTEPHSSIGLNLYFSEDIPAKIQITWYSLYGTSLDTAVFYPDSNVYFCKRQVRNYGRIVITIMRSTYPYRYVKMDYVEYGQMWTLGRDSIKAASVYEEVDCTGATLSINTAQMEIVDEENEFDFGNQEGLWNYLQKEQTIAITEYVNAEPVDCGTFYLSDWDVQKNIVKLSMIDLIGLMDKTQYYGGTIYEKAKAGEIISEIMESCGIRKYSIAEEIYHMELTGWIGIMSHRAALQQVVFACNAVADCSRGDWVRIYRPDRYVSHTIGLDRKFQGTKVAVDEYVSSVAVTYSNYILSDEVKEIVKSVLPAGRTRIEFSDPYLVDSLEVSIGTILEAKTNYVLLYMDEEGECSLSGRKYEAVENTYTANVEQSEAGENANTKAYKGCTMMDAIQAREVATRVLDYYQIRQTVEVRYLNDGEAVGNWCDIAMIGGGYATTNIINQTIDLAGGNIATAVCRGYSRTVTSYNFAGEIYAGEDGVI